MEDDRRSGTVKWFSRVKGYGFIAPDDEEKEIFVHFTGIEGEGYRNLEKGQRVSFVVEDTDKGPQAVAVRDQGFEATSWTAEPDEEPMGMMDVGPGDDDEEDDFEVEDDEDEDWEDDYEDEDDDEPPDLVA